MLIARARPLLGTVVSIQIHTDDANAPSVARAMADAFVVMARIGQVMSAHDERSDLGRLANAKRGDVLALDVDTLQVIRAAQQWQHISGGAFDPCRAGEVLARSGRRPGITGDACGSLHDMALLNDTEVRLARAVKLDFGGIAKGYAVDRAMDVLQAQGVTDALVNAGGDMRAMGLRKWPIDVRHAQHNLMDGRMTSQRWVRQQALATSVAGRLNPEFVAVRAHSKMRWQSVTVTAKTCMAADVLTKWALQSSLLCPNLKQALRLQGGRMWRTE